jgi:UDP-N-acetylmuramoyl-tripeptide--D-alanyl-D-alanine ligase
MTCEPWLVLTNAAAEHGCAVVRADGDDATEFMLRLAAAWRARHDWLVVAVTGSVGKTTTKDMLSCVLSSRYRTHATEGNLNNLIGVPLTLMAAPEDSEVVVVEMGMNHAGEISRLVSCARPQIALITNVGTAHIGLLGSRTAIAHAKAEIVAGPADPLPSGVEATPGLVLCSTDDYTPLIDRTYAKPAGVAVSLVACGSDADVSAHDITLDEDGHPSFEVRLADGTSRRASLALTGRSVVADALFAISVGLRLGMTLDETCDALASMRPSSMRQEVVDCAGGWRVIDDSYNANPSSMAAALDVLSEMRCDGRRIAVLGAMGELGDEAERLHDLVGAYAAAKDLDMLVVVGEGLAGRIAHAAHLMGLSEDRIVGCADADAALATVGPVLATGDLVLVKASRAAHLETFAEGVE